MNNPVQQNKNSNGMTKKLALILGISVGLLFPLGMVEEQIYSRKSHEEVAFQEVAKGWGEKVGFESPILNVGGHYVYPSESETQIHIETQEKKRGVFYVPVYQATLKSKMKFLKAASPNKEPVKNKSAEEDHLQFYINPISAIQNIKIRDSNTGKELKAKVLSGGIRVLANELPGKSFLDHTLEIEVSIRGTGPLTYNTDADSETVTMTGNWPKPKFIEETFPNASELSENGFKAEWKLNSLASLEEESRKPKSIGIENLMINSDYNMVERAVRYGILLIALTFMLVLIVEFLGKIKIHPLQYALIGLSISIFYLLLLAISENTSFDLAYILSSCGVIGLIGFYLGGFLKQKKFVTMIITEQIILSGFFYLLLSLEESAFLIGSLGLFLALALFMAITRKIDWYSGNFAVE